MAVPIFSGKSRRPYGSIDGIMFSEGIRGLRTRPRRATRFTLLALAALLLALPAAAQTLTAADARCRKALHAGMQRFARTLAKEQVRCHQRRIRGQVPLATDCNDPANFRSPTRIERAEAVARRAARRCKKAMPPAALGYSACPAPCAGEPVGTYDEVAGCLACLTRASALGAIESVFGSPTYGETDRLDRLCQGYVGRVMIFYLSARMRQQAHCQYLQDRERVDAGVDCVTADLRGVIAAERFAARQVIAGCSTDDIVDAQLCGVDVPTLQACVEAEADTAADTIFTGAYR